jgi:tetratricopeptide (TPR) repeat protein
MATALRSKSHGEGRERRRPWRLPHLVAAGATTRSRGRRLLSLAAAGLVGLGLAGCQSFDILQAPKTENPTPATTPTVEQPADVKYFPSDEPLRLAIENFNRGSFGLAERYFQDAVEKAPKDVTAWIGLAASYDRLARFDLADRAYRSAIRLGGETTQVLNNQGYSYMLRGDLAKARAKFLAAARRDPDNTTIANNLRLLAASSKYIVRPAE